MREYDVKADLDMPECKKCGSCCKEYPCGLAPNEIYPIAQFLGISIKELFEKYLFADYWVIDYNEPLYITPKRVGDKGFDKAGYHWNIDKRPCIFLTNNNLCQINPVKPETAKKSNCKVKVFQYKSRLALEWSPYFRNFNDVKSLDYEKLEADFAGQIRE